MDRFKRKYDECILNIQKIVHDLSKKYGPNDSAVLAGGTLIEELKGKGKSFFIGDEFPTKESYDAFSDSVKGLIETAKVEFGKHRGFGKLNPVLRFIVGLVACIPLFIPSLIVAVNSHAGLKTFFDTHETKSFSKLEEYADLIDRDLFQKMKYKVKELDGPEQPSATEPVSDNGPGV